MKLQEIINLCWEAAADSNLSLDSWAASAGLHPVTIDRLCRGITKYPRFQTVVAMAKAVNLRVIVTALQINRKAG